MSDRELPISGSALPTGMGGLCRRAYGHSGSQLAPESRCDALDDVGRCHPAGGRVLLLAARCLVRAARAEVRALGGAWVSVWVSVHPRLNHPHCCSRLADQHRRDESIPHTPLLGELKIVTVSVRTRPGARTASTAAVPVSATGPATTTVKKPFTAKKRPIDGVAGMIGSRIAPAKPAKPHPMENVRVLTREESIPMAWAICGSWMEARAFIP